MSALFDRLRAASGLSPIFADSALRRALARLNIDPESMKKSDLENALPELERCVRGFLDQRAAGEALRAIKALISSAG